MEFRELFDIVRDQWLFDGGKYRDFPVDPIGKRKYAIRHIRDHWSKAEGSIATVTEVADHTNHDATLDFEILGDAAVKMLVGALRVADIVGLQPEDIEERVRQLMAKQPGDAHPAAE